VRSANGCRDLNTWLPFLGMHSFSFCIVLTDLRFYLFSKYYLLLLWLTKSWGREVRRRVYWHTLSGDSWLFNFWAKVIPMNQGCFSIYLIPILFIESLRRLSLINYFSSGEAGTSSGKLIIPLYMFALSSCSVLPLKGTIP